MKNKTKSTTAYDVQIQRGGVSANRLHPRGFWEWECHGPTMILDPEKAEKILAKAGLFFENVKKGFLWLKQVRLIESTPVIGQLEPLLFGGGLRWQESYENLIVNTGLDDMLEQYFNGSSYTAAHYIGLTDGTPTVAAGDTMASHSGWAEVADYSESVRQTYNPATAASQEVTNTASKAVFSINGTATVGGGFTTTDDTKSGTSGTLIAAGAFSGGDKSVTSGDSLSVTNVFSMADDGV